MRASFAVVVIGRNEGIRLRRCLDSIGSANFVVYVDSGSTDGSPEWAVTRGITTLRLDASRPFSAARARNEGWKHIRSSHPGTKYIQFVDGDCEIDPTWLQLAFEFLEQHPAVGAVSGRLRERHPKASIYNWLCDLEWNSKIGEARSFGGNVMVRLDVLTSVGGYRETLVAGEDPELALRLLRAGWKIWRLDAEMGLHDAAISTFSQWWTRSVRAGYSYAAAVVLHGRGPERYKLREALRGWLWALWIPVLWVGLSVLLWPYGLFAGALYAVQMLKQMYRHSGTLKERAITAAFEMISRFAEVSGQINFVYDRLFKHAQRLIEYK